MSKNGEVVVDLEQPDPELRQLEAESEFLHTVTDSKHVAWRRWGAGPFLVLLHGGSGSWRHWARNIDDLSKDRSVLAVDLPGFGKSDGPDGDVADLGLMASWVADGLDQLTGGEEYDVVAFSYGGSTASQLVRLQPGRQRTLSLISVAGLAPTKRPEIVPVRRHSGAALIEAHKKNLMSLMLADPQSLCNLAIKIQHLNTSEARLKPKTVKRGPPLAETLHSVSAPITAIWGSKDNFLYDGALQARVKALKEAAPQAQVEIVEGAGHWAMFESAETVNELIRKTIASV